VTVLHDILNGLLANVAQVEPPLFLPFKGLFVVILVVAAWQRRMMIDRNCWSIGSCLPHAKVIVVPIAGTAHI
jgi:hypothetical protein